MKHRVPVITKKVVVGVIIAVLVLCASISLVGYRSFSRQFRIEYDEHIRAVAEAACECLNPDDFASYLAGGAADGAYDGVLKVLQDFVDKFNLNLLYVSAVEPPDYTHITYIYNPVRRDGRWSPFPLGYSEVYTETDYNTSARRVFEQGETIVRHTFKTRSGSHITAMVPVRDSGGTIVAVLGAQMSVQNFVDARVAYIRLVLAVEVLFAVLFYMLFTTFFSLSFIRPLMLVTKETDRFASYGGEPSDKLLSIKNRDELGTLAHSVHQMEIDVCRNMSELEKVTAEKERIGAELSLAAKIQSDMLPKGYPAFPGRTDFDLLATMSPAKEVGGDLYDYIMLDDDHLMLVVGDVSGKGVPAALFMGKCKVLLDFYALQTLSPKAIFEAANGQLCTGNESDLFVTCWLGILCLSTGELRYVNAGHPFPILYRAGQDSFGFLRERPNFVLGGMSGIPYTEHSVTLEKGDRLFVYTDGVTEATDAEERLFGEERLSDALQATRGMTAPETLSAVRAAIDTFVGQAEQFDDITMLTFERK